jgi:hypothetical protein
MKDMSLLDPIHPSGVLIEDLPLGKVPLLKCVDYHFRDLRQFPEH